MTGSIKHFVNLQDYAPSTIEALLAQASAYQQGQLPTQTAQPVAVANLFFENSTRTQTSFQMAESRLGYQRFDLNPAHSSIQKGESLLDTMKTLAAIGIDLAVIRHSATAWYQPLLAAKDLPIRLVNAGDGVGQHPSQTLLDLLTIQQEFGHFDGLTVGFLGDLAHSRVVHSAAPTFRRLGMQLSFAGPTQWQDPALATQGDYVSVEELVQTADVVICLRVQLERLAQPAASAFTKQDYFDSYALTKDRAEKMKAGAIIMHPGPVNRDVEIDSDLVDGPRSRIFQQMRNGVFARMAMLQHLLTAPSERN
ncbi:aspartate carbamoyltransferase catalytic subunit [Leuconostocaceae bacterium ESL0958]|nr:aspartate carbamoyltransferase catalytic subunit [Leuconostocaceae bacterium ESL0958]